MVCETCYGGKIFLGDKLSRWAVIYLGTHCYDGQIFIGGHIVMMGRYLLGDTL